MQEPSSFDYLVLLLQKVNRGELRFFIERERVYVKSREGHKALLSDNLTYLQHGSTDMLPYNLNP